MPIPVLVCAVAGPLLFVVSFLVQGALRGDGYSPLRHPVSALTYGPAGWVQQATFLVCGCWSPTPPSVSGGRCRGPAGPGFLWIAAFALRLRRSSLAPV